MDIKRFVVGEIATNCYLVSSAGEAAVIDPGGSGELILDEIKKARVKLVYVINTHGHFDHVLADEHLRNATGAKILIHVAEKSLIDFPADQYLSDGDVIRIGDIELKVLHTPGHTPGGICLLGDGFMFTGDTLFLNGIGRTDFEWSSETDMEASLKRLVDIIKPGMAIYPGHGEVAAYGIK
ncbi:MAG: MBL fold metallo-hydrolase [Candidatus Falkowbacteria bacterium]